MAINYTSRYVQLTDYMLVEYRYTSQLTPDTYSYPLTRIVNSYTDGTVQLLAPDAAVDDLGNVQERAVVQISSGQYADLDKDQVPTFLTYYSSALPTTSLTATSTPYDEVVFHLVAGYDFGKNDGVIARITATERSTKELILAQVRFLKSDDFFEYNPKPIWLAGGLYDRYYKVRVPSIKQLMDVYLSLEGSPSQSSTLVARSTSDGGAFLRNNPIHVSVTEIRTTTDRVIGGATYKIYGIGPTATVPINQADEFSSFGATIRRADSGDYFEYFASWNGGFIEDFIGMANQLSQNDYIVLHELRVYEQVGSAFTMTSSFQSIQETGYDTPNLFRPVLLNGATAVSYTIEYTCRLFNKSDSSQVIRIASLAGYDPKSWGTQLQRIALLHPPEPQHVYNRVHDGPTIGSWGLAEQVVPYTTRFVPSFYDRHLISVHKDTVYMDAQGVLRQSRQAASRPVWAQGQATVMMHPFDNYYKFTVLKTEHGGTAEPYDLGANSQYWFVLLNNQGKKVRFAAVADQLLGDPSKGDLVFKIPEKNAEDALTYNSRTFWIVSRSADGAETSLYQGRFAHPEEHELVAANETKSAAAQVADLEAKIIEMQNKANADSEAATRANAVKTKTSDASGASGEVAGLARDPVKIRPSIIANIVPRTAPAGGTTDTGGKSNSSGPKSSSGSAADGGN